jgi:hypothetical protein
LVAKYEAPIARQPQRSCENDSAIPETRTACRYQEYFCFGALDFVSSAIRFSDRIRSENSDVRAS